MHFYCFFITHKQRDGAQSTAAESGGTHIIEEKLHINSLAVHSGTRKDDAFGAINEPIYMTSNYRIPTDGTPVDWSGIHSNIYQRNRNPNQMVLQDRLCALTGAEDGAVFASGVAALAEKLMHDQYSGMIAFDLKGDEKQHEAFLDALHLVTHAVSLGDIKSLIVYYDRHSNKLPHYPAVYQEGFFRFSVGLEDAEDIIADLQQAMQAAGML